MSRGVGQGDLREKPQEGMQVRRNYLFKDLIYSTMKLSVEELIF